MSAVGLRLAPAVVNGDTRWSHAQRRGVARWVRGLFYVGFLLLLVASQVERRYGWSGPTLELTLGETHAIGEGIDSRLRLNQMELLPRPDGTLRRVTSHVSLLSSRGGERRAAIRTGQRLHFDGYSVYQMGYGPALRIKARKTDGSLLGIRQLSQGVELSSTARVPFSDERQERLLTIPEANVVARLVHYASHPRDDGSGQAFHIQLIGGRDGNIIADRFLSESGAIRAGDLELEIDVEFYALFKGESEPHLPMAAVAGTLILIGTYGLVIYPPRPLWVAMSPSGTATECQFFGRARGDLRSELAGLVAILDETRRG